MIRFEPDLPVRVMPAGRRLDHSLTSLTATSGAFSSCWRSGQEGTAGRLLPPDSDMPPVIAVARVCPILGTRAAAPHSWSFKLSPNILPSYRLLTHRSLVNSSAPRRLLARGGRSLPPPRPRPPPRSPAAMARVLDFCRRSLDSAMLTDQSHRRSLVEDVMESRIGRVISFAPMIIMMALACQDVILALWLAVVLEMLLIIVQWYRSRYNPRVAFPLAIQVTAFTVFVVLLILAYSIPGFDCKLPTPILVTAYFIMVSISLILCKPFSMQYVSKYTDEPTWRSPDFLKVHMFISGLWETTFGIMTICVWVGYGYYANTNSTGYLILNIVIPIVLPVLTTIAISYLKNVQDMESEIRGGAELGKKNDAGETEGLLEKEDKA